MSCRRRRRRSSPPRRCAILQQQVAAIQEFDSADFADLARLALAVGDGGVAATNGAAADGARAAADKAAPG